MPGDGLGLWEITSEPLVDNVYTFNAVLQDDTRAIGFESEAGILYKLESTTDVVNGVWTAANWTLTGTGGMLYVFDSNPTSATTEEYYRLVK